MASNSEKVLEGNLLRSSDRKLANEIVVEVNANSAAEAYNEGVAKCTGFIIVFAHQDVFLPPGFSYKLVQAVVRLSSVDRNWGVTGVYGVNGAGEGVGHVYSTGLRRFLGEAFSSPVRVSTLDEMVLIVRRESGLRFDEKLPGFHLYGTDICLEAEARGMRNYVLPCFALHNSNGIKYLPLSFWQAYLYLRKKWKNRLPIFTPCTTISFGCSSMVRQLASSGWATIRGRNNLGTRVDDPERFYSEEILPMLRSK